MAFVVLLDACVLYPFSLRDTLLRFAESEAYVIRWSDRILGEVTRNLVDNGVMDHEKAAWLEDQMRQAFEDALVPADAVDALEPSMANDASDRHVLAAAVASDAAVIVTANLRHFGEEHLEPYGSRRSIRTSSWRASSTSTRNKPCPSSGSKPAICCAEKRTWRADTTACSPVWRSRVSADSSRCCGRLDSRVDSPEARRNPTGTAREDCSADYYRRAYNLSPARWAARARTRTAQIRPLRAGRSGE